MERFDLFTTKIGDDGATYLSTRLKNIEELRLYKCEITHVGMEKIAAEIVKLCKPVSFY